MPKLGEDQTLCGVFCCCCWFFLIPPSAAPSCLSAVFIFNNSHSGAAACLRQQGRVAEIQRCWHGRDGRQKVGQLWTAMQQKAFDLAQKPIFWTERIQKMSSWTLLIALTGVVMPSHSVKTHFWSWAQPRRPKVWYGDNKCKHLRPLSSLTRPERGNKMKDIMKMCENSPLSEPQRSRDGLQSHCNPDRDKARTRDGGEKKPHNFLKTVLC